MNRPSIIAPVALLLLAACTTGPDYQRPTVAVPASYQGDSDDWRPATPKDDIDRRAWWSIYHDDDLNDLEQQIDVSNQNLKAAEAAYREASAVALESRAALFPSLTLDSAIGSQNGAMPTPVAPNSLSGSAAWTPDLWGRLRRGLESDKANAQISAADLASVRLSMQTALALDYFALRAQDDMQRLIDATIAADKSVLHILQNQYDSGTGSIPDIIMAKSQLQTMQAQAVTIGIRRAQLNHAIAVLIGKPPGEMTLQPTMLSDDVPDIPVGLPAALLERRPDIAAAERKVASANAQIGVATAAWFPNITLSASAGYDGMVLSKVLQASNSFWSVGPSLAESIFDAGAREDRIEQKRDAYDRSVAIYRQTVLTAFQQVADNLSSLRLLADQKNLAEAAVAQARTNEQLMLHHYEGGLLSYSDVLAARLARLASEQALLLVRQSRIEASVALIQALGGGWDLSQLPSRTAPLN